MHLLHLPGNPQNTTPYGVVPGVSQGQISTMLHNEAHSTIPPTFNETLDLESTITKSEEDQSSTSAILSQSMFGLSYILLSPQRVVYSWHYLSCNRIMYKGYGIIISGAMHCPKA